MEIIFALVGVIVVSLVSFAGVLTLSLREEILKKYIFLFISLAVGALLGDVFLHLLPEAFSENPGAMTGMLVVAGIAMFFTLEKYLHWHHHGEDEASVHPVGKLVLFSDGIHNFIDGIIIGASFLVSVPVGLATTIAVILHEIPQEIGDFAVLLHAGYAKTRALWLNFLSAILALAGAVFALLIGEMTETFTLKLLPIAAGGFIYIAIADLIPELQKAKEKKDTVTQFGAALAGVLAMLALTLLE